MPIFIDNSIARVADGEDRVGDKTLAMAPEDDEEQRPERIELLLDRERPHWDERAHRDGHEVGSEEDGRKRGRNRDCVKGECECHGTKERRQDSQRAPRVEVSQRHAARALFRDQQRGNEKTGEHEEEIDAEIAADENLLVREVRDQHRQDGDGAKSVQLWNLLLIRCYVAVVARIA